jgi:hypothetical protein
MIRLLRAAFSARSRFSYKQLKLPIRHPFEDESLWQVCEISSGFSAKKASPSHYMSVCNDRVELDE